MWLRCADRPSECRQVDFAQPFTASKISITSRKPQTTRHRILGILSDQKTQCVFVDTPGLHSQHTKALNKVMNDTVISTLRDVDMVLFVLERLTFNQGRIGLAASSKVQGASDSGD